MSNGSGAERVTGSDAPERASSFFDKTENNYRNVETRAFEARDRIDRLCDSLNGGQPREAALNKGEQDRHPAAFDRCNAAEANMYAAMNALEESIVRLEQIGLT
jgi:hypothetical protein